MRTGTSPPIDVVVVELAHIVREGIASLLARQHGIHVVGSAHDCESALSLVSPQQDAVVVISGALATPEALAQFAQAGLSGRVVVLGDVRSAEAARAALLSGAAGFVSKLSMPETLIDAVHAAAQGRQYLEPVVGAAVAQHRGTTTPTQRLTPREREVLHLIVLGHMNREIADELGVGVRTIEAHRSRLQRKLGLATRSELVSYARDHGLVDATAATE